MWFAVVISAIVSICLYKLYLVYGRKHVLARKNEFMYLQLLTRVLTEGEVTDNRTGIKTKVLHGTCTKYDLSGGQVPLLTNRRVFWRGIVEELLFFLSGSTDTKILSSRGVNIWKANTARPTLDELGFSHYPEGDMGAGYGFQWRHYGAEYTTCDADYGTEGVDQVAEVVRMLRNDRTSRRIILTGWNPAALCKMVLPPCHMMCQFLTSGKYLDCVMYQRSADIGLGVPFNIASYGLLTHMLARITGLEARSLTHMIGNAHVYDNHVEPITEMLRRLPRASPTISFEGEIHEIDDFTPAKIVLNGYAPHPSIHMDMAV